MATAKSPAETPLEPSSAPARPVPGKIPLHQWTDASGRVLLVKCVERGGKSHNGFQWPKSGTVMTPNWSKDATCESGGLFVLAVGHEPGRRKRSRLSRRLDCVRRCA